MNDPDHIEDDTAAPYRGEPRLGATGSGAAGPGAAGPGAAGPGAAGIGGPVIESGDGISVVTEDEPEPDYAQRQPGRKPPRWLRMFTTLLATGIALGIVALVAIIALFAYFSQDLPDYHSLADYQPATMTRLYAKDGKLMEEYASQRRIFTPLDEIPAKVREAFISAEDKNFYHHAGVDATGILRALVENIKNHGEGHSLVGGSTITQQVVKNFLLTNEKSVKRKITEAILAFRITKAYSKDKILELYLNEIYLGHSAYGVSAAAQAYFNKDLGQLSTEEAAMLAAMPKAPAGYDPFKNPDRAKERRNYVIGRMKEDGYINPAEADRAIKADISLTEAARIDKVPSVYFAEEVRRRLEKTYGRDSLYKGGLFVETTLDPRLQPIADKALRDALMLYDRRHGWRGPITHFASIDDWAGQLKAYLDKTPVPVFEDQALAVALAVDGKQVQLGLLGDSKDAAAKAGLLPFDQLKWAYQKSIGVPKKPADVVQPGDVLLVQPVPKTDGEYALLQIPAVNGALVAMEPSTGRVLALSGGYSDRGNTFNRATQALRQPGSAFKPFVYLTAMEHSFTPSSIVVDEPISLYQGPGLPLWTPKNYEGEYLGPATLRVGLEKSRNVMTVRLAQMLGINRVADTGERFGIYDTIPPSDRNFSMVLGAHETTLTKLAAAYATIDNGGFKVQPTYIDRIDDSKGNTLYRRDTRDCKGCVAGDDGFHEDQAPILPDDRERIVDPRIAYQMTHMLEGVALRGTGAAAHKALGIPVAGKTGTTNESRDTWFIGFTPDLVVGVFVGFDKPESLGKKETGGRVALPAFIDVMKQALPFYPSRPFEVPPGIQMVNVDHHTGLPVLPWQAPTGPLIDEAFIVGGPIFLPHKPGEEAAPTLATDDGTPSATPPDAAAAIPGASQAPAAVSTPAGQPSESTDYYHAYQQQRMNTYQQYLNQRDATQQTAPQGYAPPAGYGSPPGYTPNPSAQPSYAPQGYAPDGTTAPGLRGRPPSTISAPPAAIGTGGLY